MDADEIMPHATPLAQQQGHDIQPWDTWGMPMALSGTASCEYF
jgi:hypothetical protein